MLSSFPPVSMSCYYLARALNPRFGMFVVTTVSAPPRRSRTGRGSR